MLAFLLARPGVIPIPRTGRAEHTLQNFRTEVWQPALANRDNPDTWSARGGLRYEDRVRQKTLRILDTHKPAPLADGVAAHAPGAHHQQHPFDLVPRIRESASPSTGGPSMMIWS